MNKRVLDPCCGSKMFYFDKENKDVLFGDIREFEDELCDGRKLKISPDRIMDFRKLPYHNETFYLVVFDPPHLLKVGNTSWMAKKYGKLGENWKEDIKKGFEECFRVLKKNGVLIFKWNEYDIPLKDILALTNQKPLLGHRSGKQSKTHWITFIK